MTEAWHEGFDEKTESTEAPEENNSEERGDEQSSPPPVRVINDLSKNSFADLRKEFFRRLQASWKGIDKLLDGANNMSIHGESLAHWREYFTVDIPASPSMSELHRCMSKTNGLITTVNHKLSASQLTRDALEREVKSIKAKKFVAIKRGSGTGKAPSNDMTAMQVDTQIAEHLDQLMIAEYIVGFWENKRQALISTRKTLEAMMFGLSSEMKMKNSVPDYQESASQNDGQWPSY